MSTDATKIPETLTEYDRERQEDIEFDAQDRVENAVSSTQTFAECIDV
jgi:hypothetical protein